MDFHSLREQYKPLLKKHWLPTTFGLLGLIFFIYGLISLLGVSSTASKDVVFEAGGESAAQNSKSPDIFVDIEGGVVRPGVYKVSSGARIKDVLILAGGFSAKADRMWAEKNLNLAAKLSDGQKIYVREVGDSVILSSVNSVNTEQINVNSASREELDALPGIGPATADKIISLRPYSDINELLSKKAVGNKVFEQIKEKITAY